MKTIDSIIEEAIRSAAQRRAIFGKLRFGHILLGGASKNLKVNSHSVLHHGNAADELYALTHEELGLHKHDYTWRYRADLGHLFWWNKPQSRDVREEVYAHIKKKTGVDIKKESTITNTIWKLPVDKRSKARRLLGSAHGNDFSVRYKKGSPVIEALLDEAFKSERQRKWLMAQKKLQRSQKKAFPDQKTPHEMDYTPSRQSSGWMDSSGKIRWYFHHDEGMVDLIPKAERKKIIASTSKNEHFEDKLYQHMYDNGWARVSVDPVLAGGNKTRTFWIGREEHALSLAQKKAAVKFGIEKSLHVKLDRGQAIALYTKPED